MRSRPIAKSLDHLARQAILAKKAMVISLATAILLITPCFADTLKLSSEADWYESFRESVPVSGGLVVGVMTGAPKSSVDPSRLTVYLPEHTLRKLWVDIKSQDGRYEAHLEYDISAVPAGTHRLEFPTAYSKVLSQYSTDEVAILATLRQGRRSERLDSSFSVIAVSSWDTMVALDQITILLNVLGDYHTSIVIPTAHDSVMVRCYPIDDTASRIAYGTRCQIHLADTLQLEKSTIKRRKFHRRLPDVALPLEVP